MKRETENKLHCRAMMVCALMPPSGELPEDERRKLRNERKRQRKAVRR